MTQAADAQQYRYWNSAIATSWVTLQERLDRLFRQFSDAALANAAPAPGEYVIDVGCGCGGTTLVLARAVGAGGHVHGVDISGPMLAHAAERAATAGLGNVQFTLGNAAIHPFPSGCADLIFSRLGAMFFGDPLAAFANLRASLKPGGRMVLAVPRTAAENRYLGVAVQAARPLLPPDAIVSTTPNQPGMFSLADPERVRSILTEAGFRDVVLSPLDLSMQMGATPGDAAEFSTQFGPVATALENATIGLRERVVAAIAKTYADIERPDGVLLAGAFWIVTARAAMD